MAISVAIVEDNREVRRSLSRYIDGAPGFRCTCLCATAEEALTGADAAIITTAWPEFAAWNWAKLCSMMRRQVVVDGRNVLTNTNFPEGVTYIPIGKHFELGHLKEGAIVGR